MSPLACLSHERGYIVTGSDRNNCEPLPDILKHLKDNDIKLFDQDGSGITAETSIVVISSAIEEDNPDLVKARKLNINVLHRSEMLATFFNASKGIAVGGTNGKTTVSGMISFVLQEAKQDPSFILGGQINNYRDTGLSSYRVSKSPLMVIEADESDGSLINYHSHIALINNISRDHKELCELFDLFNEFSQKATGKTIVNVDCLHSSSIIKTKNTVTFGIKKDADFKAENIKLNPLSSDFEINGTNFTLNIPGIHNVYNAVSAITALSSLDLTLTEISNHLKTFKGMHRRLEILLDNDNIKVIDDFAHNPAKITAALKTVKPIGKRVIAFFQPHGFGPTKFMKDDYIKVFSSLLDKEDFLFMPEIFYRGGTASKDISSKDLIDQIAKKIPNSFFMPSREEIKKAIAKNIKKDDVVIIMGARDNTLTALAKDIANLAEEIS